jgi:MoxR-like ATPase
VPDFVNDAVAANGGPSPRATQAFIAAARALALIDGRLAPDVNDVRTIALPILQHRLVMKPSRDDPEVKLREVVAKLVATI